ncbi:MAG: hypothetical protein ACREO5_11345, partial [Candidatus Binatia bacterium]
SNACSAHNAGEEIAINDLEHGLHVFSSSTEFDIQSAKADRAFGLFATIAQHGSGELEPVNYVDKMAPLLADHTCGNGSADPRDAVCVHNEISGTVSSSIIFYSDVAQKMQTFYCAGSPCRAKFTRYPDVGVR